MGGLDTFYFFHKTKSSKCWFFLCLVALIAVSSTATTAHPDNHAFCCATDSYNPLINKKLMIIVDTIPNSEMIEINNDGFQEEDTTILADDSLTLEHDSLFSDTLVDSLDTTCYQINMPISKDTLSGLVKYEAEDSMVLDVPTKTFHLYGKTTTKFNDIDLKAAIVDFDQSSNML